MSSLPSTCSSDPNEISLILSASHGDPFGFLGLHRNPAGEGMVLRVFRPYTSYVHVTPDGDETVEMTCMKREGFYECLFQDRPERFSYTLSFKFGDVVTDPLRDPYSFGTVLGEQDVYFLGEGTHRRLWKTMGAHTRAHEGIDGVTFAVWAPNAFRVSVVGDFNGWDGRVHPMRNHNGIWEIFIPHLVPGDHYKFEIVGAGGGLFVKSDPFAFFSQHGPETASIIYDLNRYEWKDGDWMARRAKADPYHGPMSIYEVHLGSWKRRVD